ncbi:MAG: LamG-like jellyroll fold domain-containing protein, partial [Pseudomonadota bacterium]
EAAAAAAAAATNAAPEALAPVGLDFRDTKGFISGGPEIGEALAAAGGYTIEAWFHHDPSASEAPQTIFSNSGRGDAPSFYADVMGGELLIAVTGADGDGTAFLGEVSVAAGWNHVALVVAQGDPDDVSAYLNGSTTGLLDIEAQDVSLFFDAPLEGFLIGARSLDKGTSWHSEGAVADVRVWDVARTGDEIRDAIAQPPAADAPGLVASFALEETPDALYRASFETGEDLSSVVLTERLDIGLPGVSEVIGGADVASGSLFLYGQPDGAATFDVGDLSAVEAATLEIVLGAPSDLADFNEGGGDRFLVEVSVDGGDFVALEAFDFFEDKGFVGETTGQVFGASGGTVLFDLPTGGASVAVRLTADVTSSLEFFEVEEVAVLENVRVGDGVSAAVVGGAQVLDFSMLVAERGETVHGLLSGRDPEGAPISFELVEGPGNGTLLLDEDTGAFTYTAADGFSGDDSFSYQISDGAGLSSVQTVSLSVA